MSRLPIFDDDMMKRARLHRAGARAYFYEMNCRKCQGTQLQKKRDCALLQGYSRPGCEKIDQFVREKNKEISTEFSDFVSLALSNYTELRKDLREDRL